MAEEEERGGQRRKGGEGQRREGRGGEGQATEPQTSTGCVQEGGIRQCAHGCTQTELYYNTHLLNYCFDFLLFSGNCTSYSL